MTRITITQMKDTPLTFKRSEAFAEVRMTLMTKEGLFVDVILDIESSVDVICQTDQGRDRVASWWRRLLS